MFILEKTMERHKKSAHAKQQTLLNRPKNQEVVEIKEFVVTGSEKTEDELDCEESKLSSISETIQSFSHKDTSAPDEQLKGRADIQTNDEITLEKKVEQNVEMEKEKHENS